MTSEAKGACKKPNRRSHRNQFENNWLTVFGSNVEHKMADQGFSPEIARTSAEWLVRLYRRKLAESDCLTLDELAERVVVHLLRELQVMVRTDNFSREAVAVFISYYAPSSVPKTCRSRTA